MPIDVACECGKGFQVKGEHAGRRVKCPDCGTIVRISAPQSPYAEDLGRILGGASQHSQTSESRILAEIKVLLEAFLSKDSSSSEPTPPALPAGKKQYKVLTQKDKWFSGKFDPLKLEEAVNSYATQGWSVKGIATASVPGFGGNRDELIVLMERHHV